MHQFIMSSAANHFCCSIYVVIKYFISCTSDRNMAFNIYNRSVHFAIYLLLVQFICPQLNARTFLLHDKIKILGLSICNSAVPRAVFVLLLRPFSNICLRFVRWAAQIIWDGRIQISKQNEHSIKWSTYA